MEKLRVGVIGLGSRGHGLMKEVILQMPMVEVTAVCDAYADRADAVYVPGKLLLRKAGADGVKYGEAGAVRGSGALPGRLYA